MNWANVIYQHVALLINLLAEEYLQTDLKLSQDASITANYGLPVPEYYDFIIVGGGTAGCLLANRLSETFSVLLLEAGGDPPPPTEVPAFAALFNSYHGITFPYKTVPQPFAGQKSDGVWNTPVGRVLGGTSTINYMFYNRGSPHDFDNWANLTGDPDWTYQAILPHFKSLETYNGQFDLGTEHGSNGPLWITGKEFSPGLSIIEEAASELGIPVVDPNGPQKIIFGPIEFSKKDGRRHSSYQAFIQPIEAQRKADGRLTIKRYSIAQEVLFNSTSSPFSATGVYFTTHGINQLAYARNEVILSAGAFGSPKILLQSGIGPKDQLDLLNIPQLLELPVGQNLQEHPIFAIPFRLNTSGITHSPDLEYSETTMTQYLLNGTGPLSSTGALVAQGFIASSRAAAEGYPDWADIQYALYFMNRHIYPNPPPLLGETEEDVEHRLFQLSIYLGRIRSVGRLTFDAEWTPLIDYNMFGERSDLDVCLEAVDFALKLVENTTAFDKYSARFTDVEIAACSNFTMSSREYWECYLKQATTGGSHPSGTCAMGSVVDSKLNVLGVQNLRVVDASVMPVITNANIQGAIYGVAEKAAYDILQKWKDPNPNGETKLASSLSLIPLLAYQILVILV